MNMVCPLLSDSLRGLAYGGMPGWGNLSGGNNSQCAGKTIAERLFTMNPVDVGNLTGAFPLLTHKMSWA